MKCVAIDVCRPCHRPLRLVGCIQGWTETHFDSKLFRCDHSSSATAPPPPRRAQTN